MTGKGQAPDPVATAEAAKATLVEAEAAALRALAALVDRSEKVPGEPVTTVIARMPDREQAAAIELCTSPPRSPRPCSAPNDPRRSVVPRPRCGTSAPRECGTSGGCGTWASAVASTSPTTWPPR